MILYIIRMSILVFNAEDKFLFYKISLLLFIFAFNEMNYLFA